MLGFEPTSKKHSLTLQLEYADCAIDTKFEYQVLDSIVVSIPACHAGDRGSIPRRGDYLQKYTVKFFSNPN